MNKGRIFIIGLAMAAMLLVVPLALSGKPAPQASKPECKDRVDNDGDGLKDMADAGCSSRTDNDESNCGDGVCEGGETYATCSADCPAPDSCSDTDGGNVPATYGTVSGYLSGSPYSDNDYCVNSATINEYYCSGNYAQSSQQSCGTDSHYYYCVGDAIYDNSTDYYCASGACGVSYPNNMVYNCNGLDGYVGAPYCVGDSVYRLYLDATCSNGACTNSTSPVFQQDCGNATCYNGACY